MRYRNILPVCFSAISLSMVASVAFAESYPASLEEDLVSVCRTSAENDRLGLRRSVAKFSINSKIVAPAYKMLGEGLICNGMTLSAFTEYYGATDTLRVLDRYVVPTSIEIRDLNASRTVPEDISVTFTQTSR
ncbi:DUF3718 domain-containing protein [Alteromonas ponticola]|uniref:DUF3718 domain-containing protein n=1 Tax=Alteromonas ponticola TaxID=2720613 RepID=A0ABX1R477_9ALTE|nr:DUF3718 domain-containing protein [Alteromonas ponticola]NMH61250.1 DUF3718 domain-containing protein [Alteromonas ponticola]